MSALPYIYEFKLKIPALWWSKRSIVRRIAIDTDFEIEEIVSHYSYDYYIQIWFGEQEWMKQPLHAVNVCGPLLMPYVCAKGSFLQIAVTNYKRKLFSNRVRIAFCGKEKNERI
jgi:hypothetical protein